MRISDFEPKPGVKSDPYPEEFFLKLIEKNPGIYISKLIMDTGINRDAITKRLQKLFLKKIVIVKYERQNGCLVKAYHLRE